MWGWWPGAPCLRAAATSPPGGTGAIRAPGAGWRAATVPASHLQLFSHRTRDWEPSCKPRGAGPVARAACSSLTPPYCVSRAWHHTSPRPGDPAHRRRRRLAAAGHVESVPACPPPARPPAPPVGRAGRRGLEGAPAMAQPLKPAQLQFEEACLRERLSFVRQLKHELAAEPGAAPAQAVQAYTSLIDGALRAAGCCAAQASSCEPGALADRGREAAAAAGRSRARASPGVPTLPSLPRILPPSQR